MAEALSVTGSIVAVLQLSAKVVEYLNNLRNASEDCGRLRAEIFSTISLLYVLKEQSEKSEAEKSPMIKSLSAPEGPVKQFHQALKELVLKLLPAKGLKKVERKLIWLFKKEEIMAILR